MKIYKAAIIGFGASGLAVNKLIYGDKEDNIIAFENTNIHKRNNYFGFWMTEWMMPYRKLILKKWYTWEIENKKRNIQHNDVNHPYCIISFKAWKDFCLETKNNLELVRKKVIKYYPVNNCFKIITEDNSEFFAEKIYDSRSEKVKKNEIMQHFFGINIMTSNNTFRDDKLTLMSFTEDTNILHFIYVLPFDHNKALVESTVFSNKILEESWYRKKINEYLFQNNIKLLKEINYEKGVIPMFFSKEKKIYNKNIFNIGIRGDSCKISTGYAFSFLIKQIQIIKKTNKNKIDVHKYLDKKMDEIFLKYLKNNTETGNSFIKIADNLNGNEFQSFMMGVSSLKTKLKIIKSMPKIPFIKAIFKQL